MTIHVAHVAAIAEDSGLDAPEIQSRAPWPLQSVARKVHQHCNLCDVREVHWETGANSHVSITVGSARRSVRSGMIVAINAGVSAWVCRRRIHIDISE